MKRILVISGLMFCAANAGCMSRAIKEGAGAVTGASGKIVCLQKPSNLSHYRGLRVELITVTPGLEAPDDLPELIRDVYAEFAEELNLTENGTPCLAVEGQVIHYETGGIVNTAIGPLSELIVCTQLSDAANGEVLGQANLIGRSKAVTSSGSKNLAKGAGKALKKWLKKSGLQRKRDNEGS